MCLSPTTIWGGPIFQGESFDNFSFGEDAVVPAEPAALTFREQSRLFYEEAGIAASKSPLFPSQPKQQGQFILHFINSL